MSIQNFETGHMQDFTLVGFYGGPLRPDMPSDSRDTCDATFTQRPLPGLDNACAVSENYHTLSQWQ